MAIAKKENSVIFLEDNYEKHYEGFDPNKPETTIGLELMQEEYRSVMPSVLIETGFLTNNEEGKFLNSKAGQQKMAKAISKAITTYKNSIQANDGAEIIEEKIDTPTIISTSKNTVKTKIYKDVTFKVQLAASKTKLVLL